MRALLVIALLFAARPVCAVSLRVHGTVRDLHTMRPLGEVQVKVYKDGVRQQDIRTDANGSYAVLLENNASYVFRFSLPGRVSKCFAVETHGGAWEGDKRITDLEVEMMLFEPVAGIDLGWFDMPLGLARFTPMTGHVAWSADHERRVRPEAERLTALVRAAHEQASASRSTVR